MTRHANIGKAKANQSKLMRTDFAKAVDPKERRCKIAEILARADALPIRKDDSFDLEWDENGLPI
jgi:hypothetical protein